MLRRGLEHVRDRGGVVVGSPGKVKEGPGGGKERRKEKREGCPVKEETKRTGDDNWDKILFIMMTCRSIREINLLQ